MQKSSSTSTSLLNDLRSALTSTFVRHGYSSKIVINNGSDPISQPSSGASKLLIEVSFSSEIPLEVMMMDEVFATPINEFLKMPSFNSHCATTLSSRFRYASGFKKGPVLVIGDLVDYTAEELYRVNGIGEVMRLRIITSLASIGLSLGMGPRIKGPKEIETRNKLLAIS